MVFTDEEYGLMILALRDKSEALEREAKHRKWTGPDYAKIRQGLRDEARSHRELATKILARSKS
jgi:hypothetical protein